jgi:hypothetical protein
MAECGCGCGKQTKGGKFLPGHDTRLKSSLRRQARQGSQEALDALVAHGWADSAEEIGHSDNGGNGSHLEEEQLELRPNPYWSRLVKPKRTYRALGCKECKHTWLYRDGSQDEMEIWKCAMCDCVRLLEPVGASHV